MPSHHTSNKLIKFLQPQEYYWNNLKKFLIILDELNELEVDNPVRVDDAIKQEDEEELEEEETEDDGDRVEDYFQNDQQQVCQTFLISQKKFQIVRDFQKNLKHWFLKQCPIIDL